MTMFGKTEFVLLGNKGRVKRLTYFEILLTILIFIATCLFGTATYFGKKGFEYFLNLNTEINKLTSERWYRYEEMADQGRVNEAITILIANDEQQAKNNEKQEKFNQDIYQRLSSVKSIVLKNHPAMTGAHTSPAG